MKIGDTVKLKSGGPLMTVDKLSKNADGEVAISCIWFNDLDVKCNSWFVEGCLKIQEE